MKLSDYQYARLLDFNPHSPLQVAALIRSLGLKMPRKRGEDRETTEEKYLKRFARRYPVFNLILECRRRQKFLSTYDWPLDASNRVHSTYGFHPSTWRLSSRNVNLQNIPKRSDLAKEFRKMLVAAPGNLLVEADAAAIEAVLVAYCANDSKYMRAARAGVHGIVASYRMGHGISLDLPDAELAAAAKAVKRDCPKEYDDAKRGDHAVNYLLSAYGMHDEYPETFPTVKAAQGFIDFYFDLFPGIPPWQHQTCERASKESRITNHWGLPHYFYSVFTWDTRTQQWKLGPDAKRAVAFVPQSDAAFIQREVLLRLEAYKPLSDWLLAPIHDSLIAEVPERLADNAARVLYDEMTRPIPELGNLSVGAEVTIGPNLAEMAPWQANVV